VAEADNDCRPLVRVPPRQTGKTSSRFQPSSIPPDPSSLALAALPDDAVLAFNIRAFSPDGDYATRSHRRRVPQERKKAVRHLHLVSISSAVREPTWSNWIILLAPDSFLKAIIGDERIRIVGDAWQHAIGDVMAGPACCATG
jgi:hypothetical protein